MPHQDSDSRRKDQADPRDDAQPTAVDCRTWTPAGDAAEPPSLDQSALPPSIAVHARVDVKRGLMWILGNPWDILDDDLDDETREALHNCDAMGCGSAGAHVLAIVKIASRPEFGDGSDHS